MERPHVCLGTEGAVGVAQEGVVGLLRARAVVTG